MTPEELLIKHGIKLKTCKPGRHYTICPECSAKRSHAHQGSKCLGITIDANGARWGCNHCGWTGPEKGSGSGNGKVGASPFEATYDYIEDGEFRFQKVRYPKGHKPPFALRTRDGSG